MGWEKHHDRRYLYEKRREGVKVVSEYVGRGARALQRDRQRRANRTRADPDRDEIDPAAPLVAAYCSAVDLITWAALLAGGYHQHKGQWRYDYRRLGTCPTRRHFRRGTQPPARDH